MGERLRCWQCGGSFDPADVVRTDVRVGKQASREDVCRPCADRMRSQRTRDLLLGFLILFALAAVMTVARCS